MILSRNNLHHFQDSLTFGVNAVKDSLFGGGGESNSNSKSFIGIKIYI